MATRDAELALLGRSLLFQDADSTLAAALATMHRNNSDAAIVLRHGLPVGIVSRKIISTKVYLGQAVSEVMHPYRAIKHDTDIEDALQMMEELDIEHVAVHKEHDIVGILSKNDINKYIL